MDTDDGHGFTRMNLLEYAFDANRREWAPIRLRRFGGFALGVFESL